MWLLNLLYQHLLDRLPGAGLHVAHWMSDRNNSHELERSGRSISFRTASAFFEDLAEPDSAEAKGMGGKQHVLETGAHGLVVLYLVVHRLFIDKDGDAGRCRFENE